MRMGTFLAGAGAVMALVVLQLGWATASAAEPVARRPSPSWGAIASGTGGYGYSYNQKSQVAAEQAARGQCERPPGRPSSACEVRTVFDRSCAALVTGNFGEWGTAIAGSKEAAGKAAIAECNGHLPTEPCKVVVSVCSPG